MKTLNITLQKKNAFLLFSHAISPQWKPWEQAQSTKSPFLVEDFIADFLNRRISYQRKLEEI
ncbi:MAG: hypothetical protein HQ509_08935 [Candidatus Marinimicrobia bacterium]|nr:hypothetical protein [Candidatus Neomarinimicrobiota bacterium]